MIFYFETKFIKYRDNIILPSYTKKDQILDQKLCVTVSYYFKRCCYLEKLMV